MIRLGIRFPHALKYALSSSVSRELCLNVLASNDMINAFERARARARVAAIISPATLLVAYSFIIKNQDRFAGKIWLYI